MRKILPWLRARFAPSAWAAIIALGKCCCAGVENGTGEMLYVCDVEATRDKVSDGGGPGLGKGRHREDEYQVLDYLVSYRSGPMV